MKQMVHDPAQWKIVHERCEFITGTCTSENRVGGNWCFQGYGGQEGEPTLEFEFLWSQYVEKLLFTEQGLSFS